MEIKFFYRYSLIAAICWVILVGGATVIKVKMEESQIDEIIKHEALSTLNKDKAAAFWLMQHSSSVTPTSGETENSTLLEQFVDIIGAETKIMSAKKFHLIKDDEWLAKMLKEVERDKQDKYSVSKDDAQIYSRLLSPLVAQTQCVGCHTDKKSGDVIGVMSISIPMKSYTEMKANTTRLILVSHLVALTMGLLFIYAAFKLTKSHVKVVEEQREKEIKDYDETLDLLVGIMEERDSYTAGHSERVSLYCVLIATEMGLSKERINLILQASRLHDIGKIAVSDTVLLKPGKLDESEYKEIQKHAKEGHHIISRMRKYRPLAEIIESHHERYDGKGYPNGKKGDEIPLESSIMCVADSFDAMTTNRIYKPKRSIQEAIEEIKKCSGTQFHPSVAEAAVKALEFIETPEHTSQLEDTIFKEYKLAFFFRDSLSLLYNLECLKSVVQHSIIDFKIFKHLTIFSICGLGQFNKKFGWEAGDSVIRTIAGSIIRDFRGSIAFRVFGDIFLVLSKEPLSVNTQDLISGLEDEQKASLRLSVSQKSTLEFDFFDYLGLKSGS